MRDENTVVVQARIPARMAKALQVVGQISKKLAIDFNGELLEIGFVHKYPFYGQGINGGLAVKELILLEHRSE